MALYSLFYFTLVIIQTELEKCSTMIMTNWYLQRNGVKEKNSWFLQTRI